MEDEDEGKKEDDDNNDTECRRKRSEESQQLEEHMNGMGEGGETWTGTCTRMWGAGTSWGMRRKGRTERGEEWDDGDYMQDGADVPYLRSNHKS